MYCGMRPDRTRARRDWYGPQLLVLPFTGILNQQSIAAVSQAAQKAMRQTSHEWCLHLKAGWSLTDLARMANPIVRLP